MDSTENKGSSSRELKSNAIGWFSIFFMVITTNGPLTAMAGGIPVGIQLGNGIGLPGSFLVVSLVYLIFAVGFCTMSRYMRNSGAFYAYITQGFGPTSGISAAAIAIYAYNGVLLACYAMLGYFLNVIVHEWTGIEISWWVYCIGCALLCHFLCVRGIEFSGRLLMCMMACEIGVIIVCDVLGILAPNFLPHASLASFQPHVVFSRFGPSLVFVVAAFMGFETAAIYSQEVREPERSIPKAMYTSIIFIGLLYTVSIWQMIEWYGNDKALAVATRDSGGMWFNMFGALVGPQAAKWAELLVITSLFAAVLSFTNVLSRYWHALGTAGIAPRRLSLTHPVHASPGNASFFQLLIMLGAILFCHYRHLDPMQEVLPLASTPAAIGVLAVQCLAALAVIAFFRRESHAVSAWRRLISPAISAAALAYFVYQMILNVDLLTGNKSLSTYLLAYSVVGFGVAGFIYALYLKRWQSVKFSALVNVVVES